MQDAALRQKLETGGRKLVEAKYDWRAVSDKLSDIFEEQGETRKNQPALFMRRLANLAIDLHL